MSYKDLNVIFVMGWAIAIGIWIYLFLQICWSVYRKKYDQLKLTILYSLNTFVFVVVAGYVIGLALIVIAPIMETREASIAVLKESAYEYFQQQLLWSLIVIAVAAGVNLIYMRLVMKKIRIRLITKIAVIQFLLLTAGSVVACLGYYVGLMGEINRHFA